MDNPAANRDNEGYTGHIDDAGTGLTYMQARFYDPAIGRFLSNDPVGFMEGGPNHFNRYMYTYNDPVNLVDPDGRCPICVPAIIWGGRIAYTGYRAYRTARAARIAADTATAARSAAAGATTAAGAIAAGAAAVAVHNATKDSDSGAAPPYDDTTITVHPPSIDYEEENNNGEGRGDITPPPNSEADQAEDERNRQGREQRREDRENGSDRTGEKTEEITEVPPPLPDPPGR